MNTNKVILLSITENELRTIIAEVITEQLSVFLSETREKKIGKTRTSYTERYSHEIRHLIADIT